MLVVYNPTAGRRRASLLWRVLDVLIANGVRVDIAETQSAGHAAKLARDAAFRDASLVVAAGGDGTIAEVASGIVGTKTRMGIIPLGTANVLAHELGLPFSPTAIAAALAFGRTKSVWPGIATGPTGRRLFVQMLGVGFDAQVVHNLPPSLKRTFGRGAYVLQTLRDSVRYEYDPITIRVDDVELQAASVIVSKGRLYGGPYLLAADASPFEPGFSVVTFPRGGMSQTLSYGAMLPLGMLAHTKALRHMRGHCIEFPGNTAAPAQADGDAAGHTPFVIEDCAAPIAVVVA